MYQYQLKILLIFAGGGAGTLARYFLGGWIQTSTRSTFPLGTLVINVLGCLVIGFLSAAFANRILIREEFRLALTIGVLGGFTTFSTFGIETFYLLNDRQIWPALANIGASVILGLAAAWGGYRLAEAWLGA